VVVYTGANNDPAFMKKWHLDEKEEQSARRDRYRNARLVPLRDGSLTFGSFFDLDLLKK
jgi:hypothetical protein